MRMENLVRMKLNTQYKRELLKVVGQTKEEMTERKETYYSN